MEENSFYVVIKRGPNEIKVDRTQLIGVDQTYEGVVFNFKHGMSLNIVDNNMPNETKQLIKAADNFPVGSIVFDLNNYKNPTSLTC
jgi:hypothetical protein